jgi:hypothetical protein
VAEGVALGLAELGAAEADAGAVAGASSGLTDEAADGTTKVGCGAAAVTVPQPVNVSASPITAAKIPRRTC